MAASNLDLSNPTQEKFSKKQMCCKPTLQITNEVFKVHFGVFYHIDKMVDFMIEKLRWFKKDPRIKKGKKRKGQQILLMNKIS